MYTLLIVCYIVHIIISYSVPVQTSARLDINIYILRTFVDISTQLAKVLSRNDSKERFPNKTSELSISLFCSVNFENNKNCMLAGA